MRYLTPTRDAPEPTETAVITPVPEVEPLVSAYREQLDSAAGWGLPAHVTALGPFLPPASVDQHVVEILAAAVRTIPAFDCSFASTDWFGQDVLWLDPQPSDPFLQLTQAIWAAFPGYPPYGGVFDEVIPHLTIADGRLGDLAARQAAERAVQPGLPVVARVDSVLLIAGTTVASSWRVLAELPLGPARS